MHSSKTYYHPESFIMVVITNIVLNNCTWTDFQITHRAIDIYGKYLAEPFEVPEGSNVNLTCQSSRAFEYCTWSHKDKEGHFERKRVRIIFISFVCNYLNE